MSSFNQLAWKAINWAQVQKRLSRLQRRVYRASMENDRQKVRGLQRRILNSLDSKLIAVRRVTTENQGRNTAGVDGVKAISQDKKMNLAINLKIDGKSSNIRRVYIPKPGKKENRPLGILTIEDRAKQMLAKLALEPEWEAKFEPNSYGFRPGRSCHDAVASLFLSLRGRSRYVLDADIQQCFDRIDHEKLLQKLDTFGQMEDQIRSWLKADIMVELRNEPNVIIRSLEGTPQGGIISPLLANIALHGLETDLKDWYANDWYIFTKVKSTTPKRDRKKEVGFSRYADDFIITAARKSDIVALEKQVRDWLESQAGLELSKAKTRIINSTEGFEFLGFHFISIKSDNDEKYRIKIHPSKASKSRIIQRTRQIIQDNRSASSYSLITQLSPRIIGWANYFRYSECNLDFGKLDYLIFNQIRAWVFRRRSKGLRSRTDLKEKYFPTGKTFIYKGKKYQNNWILTGQTKSKGGESVKENFLPKMSWVGSSQHIKIKGNASPYDGNHLYWANRTLRYSGFSTRVSNLIKRQKGECAICGVPFTPMDVIEVDHIIPRFKGGSDKYANLQALHKHCHVQKSFIDSKVAINDDFKVNEII